MATALLREMGEICGELDELKELSPSVMSAASSDGELILLGADLSASASSMRFVQPSREAPLLLRPPNAQRATAGSLASLFADVPAFDSGSLAGCPRICEALAASGLLAALEATVRLDKPCLTGTITPVRAKASLGSSRPS